MEASFLQFKRVGYFSFDGKNAVFLGKSLDIAYPNVISEYLPDGLGDVAAFRVPNRLGGIALSVGSYFRKHSSVAAAGKGYAANPHIRSRAARVAKDLEPADKIALYFERFGGVAELFAAFALGVIILRVISL